MVLEITRGDDELVKFVVRDPNGVGAQPSDPTTWPLVNLTGSSLWFYVKVSSADPDSAALIAKGPSDVIINPDQTGHKGEATLHLLPADTSAIARTLLDRSVHYEVQLKDGAGEISTVSKGLIVIHADLIRATS
jgi:hypothetical protein